MDVTQDIFFTEFTDFDNNNVSFYGNEFIWKSKYIRDGNNPLWHQKYSRPCTKVLGFVLFRVISKIIGVGTEERYWGDVKKIKYIKRSDISLDVSEK